jgi:hypothetical protein
MPYTPATGFADIPSNFTTDVWFDTYVGATADCLDAIEQGPGGGVTGGEGKLRFLCGAAHLGYNDPILYPGQQGAAHLHHFFGNTLTDHNSTYNSLRTTGGGSCAGGPLNRTGYWFPAMIKPAGPGFPVAKVVKPTFIEMYYQDNPHDLDDYTSTVPAYNDYTTWRVTSYPNGLQMIFGWKHDHPIPPPSNVWLRTHPAILPLGLPYKGTLKELYTATLGLGPPSGTGYYDQINARISSLDCWDGVNLTSANGRDHLASGFQDGNSHYICPKTHPYRIPQLTVIISWSSNGPEDWKGWYLAVDRHTGHNLDGGHGFHTDWFGAWDSPTQDMWETNILGIGTPHSAGAWKTSVSGNLCVSDKLLDNNAVEVARPPYVPDGFGAGSSVVLEADRYADIPAAPGQKRLRLNLTAA